MSILKRVNTHGTGERYGYAMRCPGCKDDHVIPVKPHLQGWEFNENEACPTFSPSILVHEVKRTDGSTFSPRCHSFVRDGKWQFLSDCGHALAGQTIDMVDVEES